MGDEGTSRAIAEDVGDLIRDESRVDGHADGSDAADPEQALDDLEPVGQEQRNTVAKPDPALEQRATKAVRMGVELCEGDLVAEEAERHLVGEFVRCARELGTVGHAPGCVQLVQRIVSLFGIPAPHACVSSGPHVLIIHRRAAGYLENAIASAYPGDAVSTRRARCQAGAGPGGNNACVYCLGRAGRKNVQKPKDQIRSAPAFSSLAAWLSMRQCLSSRSSILTASMGSRDSVLP